MKTAVVLALVLFSSFFDEGHSQECVNGLISAERVQRVGRNRRNDRNEQQRIIPDISFTCSGTVTRWIVAGVRLSTMSAVNEPEAQVWRETSNGGGMYTKVHGTLLPRSGSEPSEIYEFNAASPMDVQAGDILGLFEPYRTWLQLYYTDQHGPINYYMDTDRDVTPPTGDFDISAADGIMNDMPLVTVEIIPTDGSSASECVRNFAAMDEIEAVVHQSIEDRQQRLIPGINFTCHGFITKWILAAKWANTSNLPELQTWNSTDGTTYMKQGATTFSVEGGGTEMTYYEYSPNPPHEFKDGDVLGMFIPDGTRLAIFFENVYSGYLNYIDSTNNNGFSPPVGDFVTTIADTTVNAVPLIAVEVSIPQPQVSVSLNPSATNTPVSQTSSDQGSSSEAGPASSLQTSSVGRTLTPLPKTLTSSLFLTSSPLPEPISSSLSAVPEQTVTGKSVMDRTLSVSLLPTSTPQQMSSMNSIIDLTISSVPLPETLSSLLSTVSEQTTSGPPIMDSTLSSPLLPSSSIPVGAEMTATVSSTVDHVSPPTTEPLSTSVQVGPEPTASTSSASVGHTLTPGPEPLSSSLQVGPELTATARSTVDRMSTPEPEPLSSSLQVGPELTATARSTVDRMSTSGPEPLSTSVKVGPEPTATVGDRKDRTSTSSTLSTNVGHMSTTVLLVSEQTGTEGSTSSPTTPPGPTDTDSSSSSSDTLGTIIAVVSVAVVVVLGGIILAAIVGVSLRRQRSKKYAVSTPEVQENQAYGTAVSEWLELENPAYDTFEMIDCEDREYDMIDSVQYGVPHAELNTPTHTDLEGAGYSDPCYHGEVTQERGSLAHCTSSGGTPASHLRTPTHADLESDGYSDPRYHGEVHQRSSSTECKDTTFTDENVYTQPELTGSNATAYVNTPTRADLEAEGYSDPRYYGEVDQSNNSLSEEDSTRPDLCGSNATTHHSKTGYINTPTRADLEAEGYSDPRYYGEVDQSNNSLSEEDSTRPDLCGSNATTQHSKTRYINTPTRADLEASGYSDPRYYGD